MISFSKSGNHGRFGNKLFQYAFLRTQAEKLGVNFYFPKWIGDEIFDLNDESLRADEPEGLNKIYTELFRKNYNRDSLELADGTEVIGYFESEKHFDNAKVRVWYSFKKEKITRVKEKYKAINFSKSVGMHLRLGDKLYDNRVYSPRLEYYLKALEKIGHCDNLLVFSDDMDMAKKNFEKTGLNLIFMEGNEHWEDLYLMSQCRDFICAASTLSWWGAWLNSNLNKKVVYPKGGLFRNGTFDCNKDFIPNEWIKIRALRPIVDNYITVQIRSFFNFFIKNYFKILGKVGLFLKRDTPWLFKLLKPYFPNKK